MGDGITRRGFIGAGAAAIVGSRALAQGPGEPVSDTAEARGEDATVPAPDAPAQTLPDAQRRLGFAIVGLGSFATRQILPSMKDTTLCRPAAFVTGSRRKGESFANRYGVDPRHIYDYDTMAQLRDDADVDVVYVITPPGLHAEHTIKAAEAGKHVMCEKPMATSVEDCRRMIDACKAAGKKLMIGYRVHYEPHNRRAIEFGRTKKYGDMRSIDAAAGFDIGGRRQWRLDKKLAGGGCLFDIGIYALNATRYLTGEEPVELNAMISNPPGDNRFSDEVEGNITWQMKFPSGVLANCISSYASSPMNRYRVTCTEGWYELDPATNYWGIRMRHGRGDDAQFDRIQEVNQFAAEMDHVARCILDDRTPDTPGEEGLRDVDLMLKIYEAAKTGRTVKV